MENSPTIFIVPTGIGCEVGGFAGDALPTAKLLASASGCLITHPNVMNGGTLSEKDKNIFYVEGYSLDRLANCLLYTSPSPRDGLLSRMPSSA